MYYFSVSLPSGPPPSPIPTKEKKGTRKKKKLSLITVYALRFVVGRIDENFSRTERVQGPPVPVHQSGKMENPSFDRRIGKEGERKDNRADPEMQRRNFRDNRRKNRETEKQQQQQLERPPSPETWRKPAEQEPKPASNAVGLRYGKVASALELAQAFSRSVSDSNVPDRVPSQRNLPGRSQMPFSRLMGPSPRPQINGY